MKEKINIVNKYTGLTEETITGHLNFDYYIAMAKDSIREKTMEDLEYKGIETTEKNIEKGMAEGYKIEVKKMEETEKQTIKFLLELCNQEKYQKPSDIQKEYNIQVLGC